MSLLFRGASFVLALLSLTALPIAANGDAGEVAIGERIYAQLNNKNLIMSGTTYNRIVEPIAVKLSDAARDQYDAPFRFFVVKDDSPNAFAAPGGYLFIHHSLLKMLTTKDELAGVMCHEMAHVVHHDGVNESRAAFNRSLVGALSGIVFGRVVGLAADSWANLTNSHFSRKAESAADLSGADICARAGYNPYGLVWVMESFERLPGEQREMEMMMGHPREDHRISDLLDHFAQTPALFASYPKTIEYATPLLASGVGGTHRFAGIVCPLGRASGLLATDYVRWEQETQAVDGDRVSAAPLTVDDPLALPPGETTWFKSKADVDAVSVVYDPQRRVLATCRRDHAGQRLDLLAGVDSPPFQIAKRDLSAMKTQRGIGLGSTVDEVVSIYGVAAAAKRDDGTSMLAYEAEEQPGTRLRMQYDFKDGRVVAMHRSAAYKTLVVDSSSEKHNE